jgi:hypothetical protein
MNYVPKGQRLVASPKTAVEGHPLELTADPNLNVSDDDIQLIPDLPADFVVVFDSAITIS